MPIIYVPDNTPSRNYGRNSRTEGFAHPAHGTLGGLAKSDTDPRNRGRQRSRDEIEAASRARYDAKRERLAKLREEVETKKGAENEAKEAKRLRVTAGKSAAALANNPEAARREVARQQTAAAAEAKRGKPAVRLTAEQQEANRAANQAANQRALASQQNDALSLAGRYNPQGLSETLATSEAAGQPHVARAAANMMSQYGMPEQVVAAPAAPAAPRDTRLETAQPELAAALTSAATQKAKPVAQAKPAQNESNRLISNAFSVPGAVNLSSVYSPDQQRQGLFAQQRMLAQSNPAVASLPNRIVGQAGETLRGLATQGLGYFSPDEGERAEARDVLSKKKKQLELDALLDPANLPQDPGSIGADIDPYRFETQAEEMRRKNADWRNELIRAGQRFGR